ncbi:choice-of-anchor A family protein [Microbacterium esteraromaticum]|uniref:choice-of-anchor A family protein n=1 Tax=Microbacterium esteraromaticum TaxID=57043 RepID=UPI003C2CC56C
MTIGGAVSETEGLTIVRGDLDATGLPGGFAFGRVGMGSGQWTYPDADTLAVGGDTRTRAGQTPPFVNSGENIANVPANGRVGGVAHGPEITRGLNPGSAVQYGLGAAALTSVDPGNGGAPLDFTGFNTRVEDLSAALADLQRTGTTTLANGADGEITTTWYPGNTVSTVEVREELLVTFHGDGSSALQVFDLDGAELTTQAHDHSGVSFAFENIPAGASIAVNVTGEEIAFRQGWRTLFNGVDVHDPFATPGEFARAATSVLFNYGTATKLSIMGGMGTEVSRTVDGSAQSGIGGA